MNHPLPQDTRTDEELAKLDWKPSRFAQKLKAKKRQINISIEEDLIEHFQEIADESHMTLHEAIRQSLREVKRQNLRPTNTWAPSKEKASTKPNAEAFKN